MFTREIYKVRRSFATRKLSANNLAQQKSRAVGDAVSDHIAGQIAPPDI
jgi:hypothetical protein